MGMAAAMRKGWWLLLLLTSGMAHAASFNCAKAQTAHEKTICGSPDLSAADSKMAAAYEKSFAMIPLELKEAVRNDQRMWLRGLAIHCRNEEVLEYQTPSTPTPQLHCLLQHYETRTEELKRLLLRTGGMMFIWRSATQILPDDPNFGLEPPDNAPNKEGQSFHSSWPQSTSESVEWRVWNKAIETATRNNKRWDAMYDTVVTTTMGIVTNRLVTSTIGSESNYGISAQYTFSEFNWLLVEKRLVRASDVFRSGSGWDSFIQRICDKNLHKQLDAPGFPNYEAFLNPGEMPKHLHAIIVSPEKWQLEGNGLTITFLPYEVAAPASSVQPITIPWKMLKPFLKAGFAIPTIACSDCSQP